MKTLKENDDSEAKVLVCLVANGHKQIMYEVCTATFETSEDVDSEGNILNAFNSLSHLDYCTHALVDEESKAEEILNTLTVSTKRVNSSTWQCAVAFISSAEYVYEDGEWEYSDVASNTISFKCESKEADDE